MRPTRAGAAGLIAVAVLATGCTADRPPSSAPGGSAPPAPGGSAPPAPGGSAPPAAFTPGAVGIGDPYFPTYGNGGYDVGGYDLALRYDPRTGRLDGTATISATATQNLSRFNLDLAGLAARTVTVDGQPADSAAAGSELVVTPAAGVTRGRAFTVVVEYGGEPRAIGNQALGVGGWLRTPDGAFALGQPESASTWFPVNDHPADKATFALAMTVPDGVEALSNGVPGERTSADGWTTWRWSEDAPMASYLATVVIGQYRVTSTTHDGKPMVIAIPESLPADGPAARSMARTGEVADFLAERFGPYPFDAYGGIVLDDDRVSYALETQSRPVYGNAFFSAGPDVTVVAHELAHQWFGDSVALERWRDIWLNEGFATYAEWLWQEHEGGPSVHRSFDRRYAAFDWSEPPGRPGPDGLFSSSVYQRGGMTVHALRRTIGDEAFFALLKSWPEQQRNGNVTTAEFIAAAEEAAGGRDLKPLFQAWLYGTEKPPRP
jgi:aminopeptidase N